MLYIIYMRLLELFSGTQSVVGSLAILVCIAFNVSIKLFYLLDILVKD